MDDSSPTQNRRSHRSHLWMAASLEHEGGDIPVTLRNLSADGALVEGDHGLAPGTEIIFHKNELSVSGRIAWVEDRRAGIAFAMGLDPETVLRHVSAPKPRSEEICKKRPGLRQPMSPAERRIGESLWGRPLPSIEK